MLILVFLVIVITTTTPHSPTHPSLHFVTLPAMDKGGSNAYTMMSVSSMYKESFSRVDNYSNVDVNKKGV